MPKWNIKKLFDSADKFILDQAFPEMEQPEGFGTTYSFPSDVSDLNFLTLGSLSLKLEGWLSYCIKLQAKEETELGMASDVFDQTLHSRSAELLMGLGGKKGLTEKMINAKIISEDTELEDFSRSLSVKRAEVARLKAQSLIYSGQIQRLSREQARREAESRL